MKNIKIRDKNIKIRDKNILLNQKQEISLITRVIKSKKIYNRKKKKKIDDEVLCNKSF